MDCRLIDAGNLIRRFAWAIASYLMVVTGCTLPTMAVAQGVGDRPLVYRVRVEGTIDPASALFIQRGISLANRDGAEALVVLLETPGGLDDSMRAIVKVIMASRVPVVVYVWPSGARAASAGAIITLAANVAAMSPGTAIGAAHPVTIGGGEPDKVMAEKIENDAAAYARSIARERGRNAVLAEQIVRSSVSFSETEARDKGLVDIIAQNQSDLLRQLNGRRITIGPRSVLIATRDARLETINPTLRERLLRVIGNPNFAYILMLIAIYGIIFELSNPGAVLPGVAGSISLILALFALSVLPVNLTGVLLILLAVVLFVLDVFIPGHGVLSVGGLIAFVIGSLILFETGSPVFRLSLTLVLTMAILTGGFFLYAVGMGIKAQRHRVVTGRQGMMGETGTARTDIDPTGMVFVEGELWTARSESGRLMKGERVRVVGMEKLVLIVRKDEPAS